MVRPILPAPKPQSKPGTLPSRAKSGSPRWRRTRHFDGDVNLPAFLTSKNLKPFITQELYMTSSQIKFREISVTDA